MCCPDRQLPVNVRGIHYEDIAGTLMRAEATHLAAHAAEAQPTTLMPPRSALYYSLGRLLLEKKINLDEIAEWAQQGLEDVESTQGEPPTSPRL